MSVFTIKNQFLDAYDPFWICRVLALKAGTATILLFLCNVFLKAPGSPVLYMLTTLVGVVASEVLPAESKAKKLGIFWVIIILLSMGGVFFGLLSYFKIALFLFVATFIYLVLRFMVKSPSSAALPMVILTWGIIQLEGGGATNFTAVANNLLYYFEFALMGMITIAFSPDFTPTIVKSAFIRILESNVRNIGNRRYRNSNPSVLAALFIIRSKLPLLPAPYKALYESIVQFQNDFMRAHHLSPEEQGFAKEVLNELANAVSHKVQFTDRQDQLQQAMTNNPQAFSGLRRLIDRYDQCLA